MLTNEERQALTNAKASLSEGWMQMGWGKNGVRRMYGTGSAGCIGATISDEAKKLGLNTYDLCNRVTKELGLRSPSELFRWNDHRERTQQDVIDVIDRVLMKDVAPQKRMQAAIKEREELYEYSAR